GGKPARWGKRRDRHRRQAENARALRQTASGRPRPFPAIAGNGTCGGWALRRTSLRAIASSPSESLPVFNSILSPGIDNGDEANDGTVAAVPIPREERKRAPPAGDLVDVAADGLNAENAVLEQDAVNRLPIRKILFPIASAGPFLVLSCKMRQQRTVALRPDCGGQGVVIRLGIMPHHLHFLLDHPVASGRNQSRRIGVIVVAILVEPVVAGVDDQHIMRPDRLAACLLQGVSGNLLPLFLLDPPPDPRAEEMQQPD